MIINGSRPKRGYAAYAVEAADAASDAYQAELKKLYRAKPMKIAATIAALAIADKQKDYHRERISEQ